MPLSALLLLQSVATQRGHRIALNGATGAAAKALAMALQSKGLTSPISYGIKRALRSSPMLASASTLPFQEGTALALTASVVGRSGCFRSSAGRRTKTIAQCAEGLYVVSKIAVHAVTSWISYNSRMEKATVSKLKNGLSAYLRKVRAGIPVVIYDRNVPIARLERIESTGRGADRLKLLSAQGIARPPCVPGCEPHGGSPARRI
jgi:antitoxin (DNA-binding transcriptional repressor) of toxin-antitoxin stability system